MIACFRMAASGKRFQMKVSSRVRLAALITRLEIVLVLAGLGLGACQSPAKRRRSLGGNGKGSFHRTGHD